jgi:hypothetical protein
MPKNVADLVELVLPEYREHVCGLITAGQLVGQLLVATQRLVKRPLPSLRHHRRLSESGQNFFGAEQIGAGRL